MILLRVKKPMCSSCGGSGLVVHHVKQRVRKKWAAKIRRRLDRHERLAKDEGVQHRGYDSMPSKMSRAFIGSMLTVLRFRVWCDDRMASKCGACFDELEED